MADSPLPIGELGRRPFAAAEPTASRPAAPTTEAMALLTMIDTFLIGFYPKHQDTNQGIGERYSVRATRGFVAQGTEISLKLKCRI